MPNFLKSIFKPRLDAERDRDRQGTPSRRRAHLKSGSASGAGKDGGSGLGGDTGNTLEIIVNSRPTSSTSATHGTGGFSPDDVVQESDEKMKRLLSALRDSQREEERGAQVESPRMVLKKNAGVKASPSGSRSRNNFTRKPTNEIDSKAHSRDSRNKGKGKSREESKGRGKERERDESIVNKKSRLSHGHLHAKESSEDERRSAGLLDSVIEICTGAIRTCSSLLNTYAQGSRSSSRSTRLIERIYSLLRAQRDELGDIARYAGGVRKRVPVLITLEQIYAKVESGLKDVRRMSQDQAEDTLSTLVQVLSEGPDYLIDILLITLIISHAALISVSLSQDIQGILHEAIDAQDDLTSFRRAAESIIGLASAVDRILLESREGRRGYKVMGVLVKQLQVRVASSALPTPAPSLPSSGASTPLDLSQTPTPLILQRTPAESPIVSPLASRDPSLRSASSSTSTIEPSSTSGSNYKAKIRSKSESKIASKNASQSKSRYKSDSDSTIASKTKTSASSASASASSAESSPSSPVFKSLNPFELQSMYGSGQVTPTPLPGLSLYNATPSTSTRATPAPSAPASPAGSSDSDSSDEVWEYRGQLLTRSALDLVLRQEMYAQADSSGQHAGAVSWDDLRQTWIPEWVQKLKVSDLADGEIPDTTPAGFKMKEKDEWGNKIGWYGPHKEMYYKEEPKWELPD